MVEGWGLTETSPCCTLTPLIHDRRPGSVGEPIAGVEVRIAADSEIMVRGPNVMLRYHDDPDRTRSRIDSDAWLHTGDLGVFGPDGLVIRGRRDGVFKLANGEKVSSQVVEMALAGASSYIEAVVAAGSGQNAVAAVVVPSFPHMEAWAEREELGWSSHADLIALPEARALLIAEVERANAGIEVAYARVRGLVVLPRSLALELGELTPSTKVVRPKVLERFGSDLAAVFDQFGPRPAAAEIVSRVAPARAGAADD